MSPTEFIEVVRDAVFVLLLISAPPMLAALVVGLIISLFQALTQIQEATLTFVPKIITLLLVLILALPFMVNTLLEFTHRMAEKIERID